jgi:hypothetical protein
VAQAKPEEVGEAGDPPGAVAVAVRSRRSPLARLTAGGTDGNEQLTAITGVVLILMLAALGVTILRIGALLDAHMFIGMLLIGPLALKLASTGYRFARYYTSGAAYRRKGPPPMELRLLAPALVVSTVAVFATGVALLFAGPGSRGVLTPLHKVSFIFWLAVCALHVLGHLAGLPAALAADRRRPWDAAGSGRGARLLLLAGAIVGGLVLALLVESQFAAWAGFHHR